MAEVFCDTESSTMTVHFYHEQSSLDYLCTQCEKLLQFVKSSMKESMCVFSLEILTSERWIEIK